jgi:hypothetical protein
MDKPLRFGEIKIPTRHCEAQHAVAPNAKPALKQSLKLA